jgi:hypothetical protein
MSFDRIRIIPHTPSRVLHRDQVDLTCKIGKVTLGLPFIVPGMQALFTLELMQNVGQVGGLAIQPRNGGIAFTPTQIIAKTSSLKSAMITASILTLSPLSILIIEIANGHMQALHDKIGEVRKAFPDLTIWAGAVCTAEGVIALHDAGADAAIVGIGVGQVCETYQRTGVGLSALDTVRRCSGNGLPIILGGGLKSNGDACKALIWADAVMVGNLVKRCSDTATKGKSYFGETSRLVKGEIARYIEGGEEHFLHLLEGTLPQRKSSDVMLEMADNLRTSVAFSDSFTLPEYRWKAIWESEK